MIEDQIRFKGIVRIWNLTEIGSEIKSLSQTNELELDRDFIDGFSASCNDFNN